MSGAGLFNSRTVAVGDLIELKLPIGGGADWRVISYDSVFLSLAAPPKVVDDGDGTYSRVFTVVANVAGDTEVVLERIDTGEQKVFKISISGS